MFIHPPLFIKMGRVAKKLKEADAAKKKRELTELRTGTPAFRAEFSLAETQMRSDQPILSLDGTEVQETEQPSYVMQECFPTCK